MRNKPLYFSGLLIITFFIKVSIKENVAHKTYKLIEKSVIVVVLLHFVKRENECSFIPTKVKKYCYQIIMIFVKIIKIYNLQKLCKSDHFRMFH